jgi:transcription initiation factor IIE alpha subunit
MFRNYYQCPDDRTVWQDEWSCTCNDRCPVCDKEVEPYHSEDISTDIEENEHVA